MKLEEAAQAHSWIHSQTAAYLEEMGVLPKYLPMIMATNSGEILWLAKEDIDRDFEGIINEHDEWFRAMCPSLSAFQVAEDERLRQQHIKGKRLTEQEEMFRAEVDRISTENGDCVTAKLREVQERSRQAVLNEVLRKEGVTASGLQDGFRDLRWGGKRQADMIPAPTESARREGFDQFLRRDTVTLADRETAFVLYSYYKDGLCRVTVAWDGIRGTSGIAQIASSLSTSWGRSNDLSPDGVRGWMSQNGATVAILHRPESDNLESQTSALMTISSTSCLETRAKDRARPSK